LRSGRAKGQMQGGTGNNSKKGERVEQKEAKTNVGELFKGFKDGVLGGKIYFKGGVVGGGKLTAEKETKQGGAASP